MTKRETIVSGGFQIAPVEREDILAIASNGQYVRLTEDFLANTQTGDFMKVENAGDAPLSEAETERMYQGIRRLIQYRAKKAAKNGDDKAILPIAVHKRAGQIYLERL